METWVFDSGGALIYVQINVFIILHGTFQTHVEKHKYGDVLMLLPIIILFIIIYQLLSLLS